MITQYEEVAIATFRGILQQTGTADPTFIPLINTLEVTAFMRLAAGIYSIITAEGYNTGAKWIITNSNGLDAVYGAERQNLSIAAANDYSWYIENGSIKLIKNSDLVLTELSSLAGGLLKIYVQIEMYNNGPKP